MTTATDFTSTKTNESISITEQTTPIQNSTQTILFINDTTPLNNETTYSNDLTTLPLTTDTFVSTSNYSIDNQSLPIDIQMNETTENMFNENATLSTFLKNNSYFILNLLNRTRFRGKNLVHQKSFDIYNTTAEEAARHLTDRKAMQSLIHLLPPNLWSQIQKNFSIINYNKTKYNQPSLPDPVILAEAAAQAGLPGPGPYPIPDHLWYQSGNYFRNPAHFMNNIPKLEPTTTTTTSTCSLNLFFSP